MRHAGQQKKFAFVQETPSQVLYAAHYADCEQEFLPVQKGYQLVLLYNISYQVTSRAIPVISSWYIGRPWYRRQKCVI